MTGWGYPYKEWPQALKDEYAYNPTQAKKLLSDAGYPTGFKTTIWADKAMDIDFLQIIKSEFLDVGIDMAVTTMDPTAWVAFVQQGYKQDALAFKSAGQLGKSYQPTYVISTFQTGVAGNWLIVSDPVYDALVVKTLAATSSLADVKQGVHDIDERVVRQHYDISLLNPTLFGVYAPWFHGYNGQYNSLSHNTASALLYFYPARFWIDSKLKASLGH